MSRIDEISTRLHTLAFDRRPASWVATYQAELSPAQVLSTLADFYWDRRGNWARAICLWLLSDPKYGCANLLKVDANLPHVSTVISTFELDALDMEVVRPFDFFQAWRGVHGAWQAIKGDSSQKYALEAAVMVAAAGVQLSKSVDEEIDVQQVAGLLGQAAEALSKSHKAQPVSFFKLDEQLKCAIGDTMEQLLFPGHRRRKSA